MNFHSAEDAKMRLSNSLIRVNESPAYISDINHDYSTHITYPLNGKKSFVKDIREVKGINYEPVPLGYVNDGNTAHYLRRIPHRRWKQGLTGNSIDAYINRPVNFLKSRALSQCIKGRYPSLEDAYNLVSSNKKKAIAFHRNWACSVGVVSPNLMYKGRRVGILNENMSPSFHDKYEFLIESFNEEVK